MNQISMPNIFATPEDYKPPPENQLKECTFYPNLNSTEYMKKPPNFNIKLQKFYEAFDINENGSIALACNDYTARVWNGSLWGFENIEDFGNPEKATYKTRYQSTITDIKFSDKSIVSTYYVHTII